MSTVIYNTTRKIIEFRKSLSKDVKLYDIKQKNWNYSFLFHCDRHNDGINIPSSI